MTGGTGRYSRVYWTILDDPKFLEVYDDDRSLATWLRLLIAAEMAYPASAIFPTGTSKKSVDVLVSAGLVELAGANRYRIVGLAAERERRSAPGRAAASARWSRPNANALRSEKVVEATALPEEKEKEKEKEKEEEARIDVASFDDDDHLEAYYRLTASWPTPKIIPWLNDLADKHGSRAVSSALAEETLIEEDRRTLLSRTQTRLERAEHERKKKSERLAAERAEKEKIRIESMPEEQRRENLDRLRQMLASSGLASERKETE